MNKLVAFVAVALAVVAGGASAAVVCAAQGFSITSSVTAAVTATSDATLTGCTFASLNATKSASGFSVSYPLPAACSLALNGTTQSLTAITLLNTATLIDGSAFPAAQLTFGAVSVFVPLSNLTEVVLPTPAVTTTPPPATTTTAAANVTTLTVADATTTAEATTTTAEATTTTAEATTTTTTAATAARQGLAQATGDTKPVLTNTGISVLANIVVSSWTAAGASGLEPFIVTVSTPLDLTAGIQKRGYFVFADGTDCTPATIYFYDRAVSVSTATAGALAITVDAAGLYTPASVRYVAPAAGGTAARALALVLAVAVLLAAAA